MQNRSNLPIELDQKILAEDFPASCQYYTQHYQKSNSLHYHDCMELGRCISGSGVQYIGGEMYSFSPNSITVLLPACVHDSHIIMQDPAEKPSQWQYIFIKPEALGIKNPLEKSFLTMEKSLCSLFEIMFAELAERPGGWQEQMLLLLPAFLRAAKRSLPQIKPMMHGPMAQQIEAALHIIANEYPQALSVSGLADRCNMSVSYFRKLFTINVGMSPQQYILHVRLSHAEQLLRATDQQILSISQETGFQTLSSFNRHFRRVYGMPPSALRRGK